MTKRILMTSAVAALAAGIGLASGPAWAGGVIDFDGETAGTVITNQFNGDNAEFASPSLTGTGAIIFNDPAEATSGPNILVGQDGSGNVNTESSISLEVVDAGGDPQLTNSICGYVISVGHNELVASALDASMAVVDSQSFLNLSGPENGLGNQDPFVLFDGSSPNIAAATFVIPNPDAANDGFGLDDVQVGCDVAKVSGKLSVGEAGKRGTHSLDGVVWNLGSDPHGEIAINYKTSEDFDAGEAPVECVFTPDGGTLTIVGGVATLANWAFECTDSATTSGTADIVMKAADTSTNNKNKDKERGSICVDGTPDAVDIGGADCNEGTDFEPLINGNVILIEGEVTSD